MKGFIAATLALLTFAVAGVGQAANTRPCSEWASAQTSSGQTFSNYGGCASYSGRGGGLYTPTASANPSAVGINQPTTITGTGFHPNANQTVYYAVEGYGPYFSQTGATDANGGIQFFPYWDACGAYRHLVLTLVDSYGVHASVQVTLC